MHVLNFFWMFGVQLPDAPLYYSLSSLASVMKLSSIPSRLFQAAVLNAGYKARTIIFNLIVHIDAMPSLFVLRFHNLM